MKEPAYTPQELMHAHQFLYYNGRAVWSDYKFDQFCKQHGLDGSGGSDSASSYTPKERTLAEAVFLNPHAY